jgi:hypothetical protein
VSFARRARAALVLLAGIVFLPGVLSPYWLDDWGQRAMVRGTYGAPRSAFDLYSFVGDGDRAALIERGVLPWWTHPHLVIRFFRPLSSFLRWIDFQLSDAPLAHHVHSLVWWAVAVMGARAFYEVWLSKRAAAIATFAFAVAPCLAVPVSWLANRDVLVSLAFGTFALAALARGRMVMATALFSIAMLAGEYSLALGGYAIAIAIFARKERRARLATLASFFGPAVLMLAVRAALGFGTRGSGFYRDPLVSPGAFLTDAPRRLGAMVAGVWLASETEWLMDAAAWTLVAIVAGIALVAWLASRRPLAEKPEARAFAFGSVLALVPMVAALPATRMLGVGALGVAPVVAMALDHAWNTKARLALACALVLSFFHLARAPVVSFLAARSFRKTGDAFGDRVTWLRKRLDERPVDAKVVVARAGWQTVLFSPFALDPDARMPKKWRVLSLAPHALMLRRGPTSVEILVAKGKGYLPTGAYDVLRTSDDPLRAGDAFDVAGMHVTIVEGGGQGGPGRARFDFDEPLDDSVWIEDSRAGWQDAPPPRLGFGAPLDP